MEENNNQNLGNQERQAKELRKANQAFKPKEKKPFPKKAVLIGAIAAVVLFVVIFGLVLALKSPVKYDEESGITVSVPKDALSMFQKSGLKLQVEEQKADTETYAKAKEVLAPIGGKFVLYDLELVKNGREVEFDGKVTVSAPVPKGFHLNTKTMAHPKASKLQSQMPHIKSLPKQEHNPAH